MKQRTKSKEQRAKRRYNIHYKLRKKGITILSHKRTIKIDHIDKDNIDDLTSKYFKELEKDYQYGIQLTIQ